MHVRKHAAVVFLPEHDIAASCPQDCWQQHYVCCNALDLNHSKKLLSYDCCNAGCALARLLPAEEAALQQAVAGHQEAAAQLKAQEAAAIKREELQESQRTACNAELERREEALTQADQEGTKKQAALDLQHQQQVALQARLDAQKAELAAGALPMPLLPPLGGGVQ